MSPAIRITPHDRRLEHDLLGELPVPNDAYWGVHTLRAQENFPITGRQIATYPEFVNALAAVKQAAATANAELGLLAPQKAHAIVTACKEIRSGRLHDQFVVDVIQGGAGTSTNMNANEVIANLALEHVGLDKGRYERIHPLDDVNRGQSTNDVYPTALKLALHVTIGDLDESMAAVRDAFAAKAREFSDVLKVGRTQLQDAVPMTLGQEFASFAVMVNEDRQRLTEARALIREINLGGTAIGTGLNAHPGYSEIVCQRLSEITGIGLVSAPNLIEATQDVGSLVQLSGVLKRVAVKLSKICSDLRLLSSGPRAGFGEINLAPVQAGSSIMPGKVNPVIPEVVNQVAFEVVGNDVTISLAADAGQLQLNAFEPLIAHSLFKSLTHLRAGCQVLASRCIPSITANRDQLQRLVENSIGLVTALTPHLGYTMATALANEAGATNKSIPQIVLEQGLLDPEQLNDILQHSSLTGTTPPLPDFD